MKTLITSFFLFIGIMSLSSLTKAQDYNDLGRSKTEEFTILKFNGYKVSKVHSNEENVETYIAKRATQSQYDNIITIDKATQTVIGVIWNFDSKNMEMIKSLLSDMNPTDTSSSRLENKKGIAMVTIDPFHDGYGMIVWKKKA